MARRNTVEDLQAVSQHVMTSAEKIAALEREKRHADPGSDAFRKLSDEIEAAADEIRAVSHAETGLAEEIAGQDGLPTVADAAKQR